MGLADVSDKELQAFVHFINSYKSGGQCCSFTDLLALITTGTEPHSLPNVEEMRRNLQGSTDLHDTSTSDDEDSDDDHEELMRELEKIKKEKEEEQKKA